MKINKVAVISKVGSKESEKAAQEVAKKLLKLKYQVFTIAPVSVAGTNKIDSLELTYSVVVDFL